MNYRHSARCQQRSLTRTMCIKQTENKKMLVLSGILLLLILFVFSNTPSQAANELDLQTAEVKTETITQQQSFDAVIEAARQATVSAQTSGRIVEINFDVDDLVPKGSVILRFRDTEQRAALKSTQAGLKEAEARYKEAQSEFNRVKDLLKRKLVSQARSISQWK